MARVPLPPGFLFHLTDVELVMYYLKRKVFGRKFQFEAISELNIYKFSPWDLPDKSRLKSSVREWFFFCPRERKYASGGRINRATETGYWRTTGKDRAVLYKGNIVGMIKTLVFHLGHAPHGERTDWVIHEYRILDKKLTDAGINQDSYVLCKVFHKNGLGPKNGAQSGASFKEEEWDDDIDDCYQTSPSNGSAASGPSSFPAPESPSFSSVARSMGIPESTSSCSSADSSPSFDGAHMKLDVPDEILHSFDPSFCPVATDMAYPESSSSCSVAEPGPSSGWDHMDLDVPDDILRSFASSGDSNLYPGCSVATSKGTLGFTSSWSYLDAPDEEILDLLGSCTDDRSIEPPGYNGNNEEVLDNNEQHERSDANYDDNGLIIGSGICEGDIGTASFLAIPEANFVVDSPDAFAELDDLEQSLGSSSSSSSAALFNP